MFADSYQYLFRNLGFEQALIYKAEHRFSEQSGQTIPQTGG